MVTIGMSEYSHVINVVFSTRLMQFDNILCYSMRQTVSQCFLRLVSASLVYLGRQSIGSPTFMSSIPPNLDIDVRGIASVDVLLNRLDAQSSSNTNPDESRNLTNDQKCAGFSLICTALNKLVILLCHQLLQHIEDLLIPRRLSDVLSILNSPGESKFRTMKKSNKNVQNKVHVQRKLIAILLP